MAVKRVVCGQRVSDDKLLLAKQLRSQMTAEECILWKHLRGHRLQRLHFRRQQIIDGFVVDFYCSAASLVVEVDGGVHRAQVDCDAERDQVLALRGLRVLRIPNEDVARDIDAVLARIAAAAAQPAPAAPAETSAGAAAGRSHGTQIPPARPPSAST